MQETVMITKEELIELLKNDFKLYRLESMGVDNWEWYGEALGGEDDEDDYETAVDKYVEEALKKYVFFL